MSDETPETEASAISPQDILALLPHRYPILLVDKVLEVVPGERILAVKNVSFNEPYFAGHFPGNPVMPGVLILEALAQATALLGFRTQPEKVDQGGVLLMGIDKARFRVPVRPGDQLQLSVTVERVRGPIWKTRGIATVDGKKVASCDLMATFYEGEVRG